VARGRIELPTRGFSTQGTNSAISMFVEDF
jgi:hypothetical protein